jgi:hypothetical protein
VAVKAKGTILEHSAANATLATPGTFTPIARVRSIKPPKRTSKGINTTVLESDAEEMIPGLPAVGDSEAKIEYEKTRAADLDALFNQPRIWRLHYPDNSGRMFEGWISEDGEDEVAQGDVITQTIKITATGNSVPVAVIT